MAPPGMAESRFRVINTRRRSNKHTSWRRRLDRRFTNSASLSTDGRSKWILIVPHNPNRLNKTRDLLSFEKSIFSLFLCIARFIHPSFLAIANFLMYVIVAIRSDDSIRRRNVKRFPRNSKSGIKIFHDVILWDSSCLKRK